MDLFKETLQLIDTEQVKLIDFKIVAIKGCWHRLSIPVERFTERIMTECIGFDGSSYGFLSVEKSDMVFIPDLSTAFIDPFTEIKTLIIIADIYRLENGKRIRFEDDPSYIAEKAEGRRVRRRRRAARGRSRGRGFPADHRAPARGCRASRRWSCRSWRWARLPGGIGA